MRLKLDENLPVSLCSILAALGHDVDTAPDEGLAGEADDQIWQAAQSAARFLATQDLDFSDARRFTPGTHQGLLPLRLNHPSRQMLADRISQSFTAEDLESWARCIVVATRAAIRIRRP
jgi:predicted nuclease of predicted toxin-antitoxin system